MKNYKYVKYNVNYKLIVSKVGKRKHLNSQANNTKSWLILRATYVCTPQHLHGLYGISGYYA